MRQILLVLTVFGIALICDQSNGLAQQRPQRRPLTITYRAASSTSATSITKTQWSPESAGTSSAVGGGPIGIEAPGYLPGVAGNSSQQSGGLEVGSVGGGVFNAIGQQQPMITNQQLQNPSGGFNISHTGFSQNYYVSPNNYFGPQYQTWSNMGLQPTATSGYGAFNRFQPPINSNSGAYFTPITYIGPANNQWSNLSSGTVTPNINGGWSYTP